MATIKAGTYRFNGLLDSCGYSVYFEESIQFYNTIPFLIDEEYSALIKAETGFDLATGTYYLKRRCGGFRLSFTAGERYKNWVDYTQVYPVSATPFVPDELLALLPQGIDDIMYDSYAYPYDYYTDVNVWDEEGGNIVTIPEDSEVSEEFGVWFAANANRLSTITYNGSTIASLLGGQKATLKCKGMEMVDDVVVDVAEIESKPPNIQPLTITENGTYTAEDGVDGYSPVTVEVAASGGDAEKYLEAQHAEVVLPNVTSIKPYAFYQDKVLTNIEMPKVTSIGDNAFNYCSKLTLTSLPSGVTSIGHNAFRNCTNLALTSLPSGLTSIGLSAFESCSKLNLTSLPNSLTQLNNMVFKSCANLAITSLPSGLTRIGTQAFFECYKLASITFEGKPQSIDSSAFRNCTNLTTINVPWADGEVSGAPWGATSAQINYNYVEGE